MIFPPFKILIIQWKVRSQPQVRLGHRLLWSYLPSVPIFLAMTVLSSKTVNKNEIFLVHCFSNVSWSSLLELFLNDHVTLKIGVMSAENSVILNCNKIYITIWDALMSIRDFRKKKNIQNVWPVLVVYVCVYIYTHTHTHIIQYIHT